MVPNCAWPVEQRTRIDGWAEVLTLRHRIPAATLEARKVRRPLHACSVAIQDTVAMMMTARIL
jgi:hypothetical protein